MKEFTESEYYEFLKSHNSIELFGKKFELKKPVIKELQLQDFKPELTTLFSFEERGIWATHYLNAAYRGNFAPQIARNMILRYSKEGETVLDPMCGSGTTLIECKLLNRNGVGIDLNKKAVIFTRNRLDFDCSSKTKISTYVGDARKLDKLANESIDLIVTHPPYANIIEYGEKIEGDLSALNVEPFVQEMRVIAKEFYRVLKPDHYCAILMGDTRKKKHYVPMAFMVMQEFLKAGFLLKEDIIKEQWNCSATPYWEKRSLTDNFFLIMHEHLFVFRKPEK